MQIKSVSMPLLRQMDKLVMKLTVNLMDTKNMDSFYNLFETARGSYLTLNIDASIVFQYKDALSTTYDPSHTIRITDEVIYQVNKSFQSFYKKLMRQDLFSYYSNGAITCNPRRSDKETISLKTGGFIELEPGVIADTNTNQALPGVFFYINKKENKCDISIDEFENIMYKLTKIDPSKDGLDLVIGRMLIEQRLEKNSVRNTNYVKDTPKTNIFQKKDEQLVELVEDRRLKSPPTSLEDLMR